MSISIIDHSESIAFHFTERECVCGSIEDVSACGGAAIDGEDEGDNGDCGAGRGAEREGGADWAVQQDADRDPEGSGGRRVPEGGGEFHEAQVEGVPGGRGLGGNRESSWVWPGRGAHRGGSR